MPNEADRRSYFLEVTPEGSEFLEAMEPILDAAGKAIEGELGVSLEEYRDPLERLRKAKEMLDGGLITDAEFESIKARVVEGL